MREKTYTDEETQQAVLKELPKTFSRVSGNIDTVEKNFLEDDAFDPNQNAEIFDRPDLTIENYLLSEMKNLHHGLSFLGSSSEEKALKEEYQSMILKIEKVFKPEKFIKYSVGFVMNLITDIERDMRSHSFEIEDIISIKLGTLHTAILGFNSYLNKVRGIEIDQKTIDSIAEINEELKKIPMPLIEV
jgi:hypothetical protein